MNIVLEEVIVCYYDALLWVVAKKRGVGCGWDYNTLFSFRSLQHGISGS